jgi:hypothetical protein
VSSQTDEMLGILHSASVIGIKQTAFRGKEKTDDMHTHISKITAGIEKLQSKYEVCEYNRRHGEALLRLTHTYSREQAEETKELFFNVLPQDHVPSAKEQKEGVDTAAIMDGKLQLGKLHKKGETLLCFRWSCPDGWSQNMVERLLRMRRPPSKSWGFKS